MPLDVAPARCQQPAAKHCVECCCRCQCAEQGSSQWQLAQAVLFQCASAGVQPADMLPLGMCTCLSTRVLQTKVAHHCTGSDVQGLQAAASSHHCVPGRSPAGMRPLYTLAWAGHQLSQTDSPTRKVCTRQLHRGAAHHNHLNTGKQRLLCHWCGRVAVVRCTALRARRCRHALPLRQGRRARPPPGHGGTCSNAGQTAACPARPLPLLNPGWQGRASGAADWPAQPVAAPACHPPSRASLVHNTFAWLWSWPTAALLLLQLKGVRAAPPPRPAGDSTCTASTGRVAACGRTAAGAPAPHLCASSRPGLPPEQLGSNVAAAPYRAVLNFAMAR